jgi:toxin YoeB
VRKVVFHATAFEDFSAWARADAKMFERIVRLISESARDPFQGIGKPEPLRHELKGFWSRRINDEHRLVYRVTDDSIIIASCRFHYE